MILDRDLAVLYGVSTGNLNKAVSRNLQRFPEDFMLRPTPDEVRNLIFQFGTSSRGGRRKPPRAFTQEGIAMLSGVLHSPRAVRVNIEIMRAFVRLRRILLANVDLARQLAELEQRYDAEFRVGRGNRGHGSRTGGQVMRQHRPAGCAQHFIRIE